MTKYVVPGSTKRGRNKRKGWVPRAAEIFFFFITKDHEFSLTKTKQTKQNGAMNVMELFSLIFILFYITSYTYSIFLYKKKEFTEYFIYTN